MNIRNPQKSYLYRNCTEYKYQISTYERKGGGRGGRYRMSSNFSQSKRRKSSISPLLIDLEGWFFDTFDNFWFPSIALKRVYLCVFNPQHPLSQNWNIAEFLPKFISTRFNPPLNWADWQFSGFHWQYDLENQAENRYDKYSRGTEGYSI